MKRPALMVSTICLLACLASQAAFGLQYFEASTGYNVASYPIGIAATDFNGDTYPDIVTANNAGNSISVLPGDGDGIFAARINYSTGSFQNPYYVVTGDMDGNGTIDIITGGTTGIVIFYGVDTSGKTVASGIYLNRNTTDKYADSKKMVLIK